MEVKDNIIVKATEAELFDYYLTRGFDDIMSFYEYVIMCKLSGTEVEKE